MPIIVETGAGVEGANSFASIVEADDFHSLRNNTAWASATSTEKTAALVNASDYLNTFYVASCGPLSASQGLQWPTMADSGLPAPIRAATLSLALYALSGPLTGRVERGVKATSQKLDGVGETSTTFEDSEPGDAFPAITAMLAGIASTKQPGTIRMGRLSR